MTRTRRSATCSTAPRTSPLIPPRARHATSDDDSADRGAAASRPTHHPVAAAASTEAMAAAVGHDRDRPTGRSRRPGPPAGPPAPRPSRRRRHRARGCAPPPARRTPPPGASRRRRRCAARSTPRRGHAVRAVARVVEDLQPPLARPPAHGVGGVGEPVLVERPGEEHAGRRRRQRPPPPSARPRRARRPRRRPPRRRARRRRGPRHATARSGRPAVGSAAGEELRATGARAARRTAWFV